MKSKQQVFVIFYAVVVSLSLSGFLSPLAFGFSGGNGTVTNPYQVSTREHLEAINDEPSANYILINDIDLAEITYSNAVVMSPFTGAFDGDGFVIYNLTIVGASNGGLGLFSTIEPGSYLADIGLENCIVSGGSYSFVGGLVGYNNNGTITDCYVEGNISGDYTVGGLAGWSSGSLIRCYTIGNVAGRSYVGGLAGRFFGTIDYCYANVSVNGTGDFIGGLVGQLGMSITYRIRNSYAIGTVSGNLKVGGLVGSNGNGRIIYSFSTGTVNGNSEVGGLVGVGHGHEDTGNFWDIETSTVQQSSMGRGETTINMQTRLTFTNAGWDFENVWEINTASYPMLLWQNENTFITRYSGGKGSPANPYKISSVSDWQELMNNSDDWSKLFVLVNDIDLGGAYLYPIGIADYNANWQLIGLPFNGVFDGSGHTISNVSIYLPQEYFVGLFGYIGTGGKVFDLCLENVDIAGASSVGGICGINRGQINQCYVQGNITGLQSNVGGLCGWNHWDGGTIYQSASFATVSGDGAFVGGLCGRNQSNISESYSGGNVANGGTATGGLCGLNDNTGVIKNSYAFGDVTGGDVGGLVGRNWRGKVSNSYSIGRIYGDTSIGGLCARVDSGLGYEDNNNFWNVETSEVEISQMGVGKTTLEMMNINTFLNANWDFETVWFISKNRYPKLQWTYGVPTPDLAGDSSVNIGDFIVLTDYALDADCQFPDWCGGADLNRDGIVNLEDFAILAAHWLMEF